MITITPKDALQSKQVTPGWQILDVTNHYTKPAAGDGSTVHYFELEIKEGTFKGVPLTYIVSEKAPGMAKAFFFACGLTQEMWDAAEKGESIKFDEKLCIGKVIKGMITNDKYDNRVTNKVTDFLPLA
jgi:hypothetical protein